MVCSFNVVARNRSDEAFIIIGNDSLSRLYSRHAQFINSRNYSASNLRSHGVDLAFSAGHLEFDRFLGMSAESGTENGLIKCAPYAATSLGRINVTVSSASFYAAATAGGAATR